MRNYLLILVFVVVLAVSQIVFAHGIEITPPTIPNDVILPPKPSLRSDLPEICLVFIQGADIKPDQYVTMNKAIQEAAKGSFKVWVGIPEFYQDYAEPLVLNHGIERVLNKMQKLGMPANTTLVMAGHSLGGAMVQLWTEQHQDQAKAQILMGSFLTRMWKKDKSYQFSYPVHTMTIGGELDGLARVTRIAEAYYTQMMDPNVNDPANAKLDFPVTVIPGVTHMQFADGEPPALVAEMDLLPEVSYDQAHQAIAQDVTTFLQAHFSSSPTAGQQAKKTLQSRLDETLTFINPILNALHYEGYHNFRPPCLCPEDTCEPSPTCTAGSPFTNEVSQVVMGSGLDGVTIKNTDSFHDVWETEPTVHLPKVLNSCATPEGCTLETTTITQAVYHTGEDLEVWKKHFDLPGMDSGFLPISARELRTKMSARQNIYKHAGIADPNFDELDGGDVRCSEINQQSWNWASKNAGDKTIGRFQNYGQGFIMGQDIDVCPAGPCWIWKELSFNYTATTDSVEVRSPQFSTAIDFWLPKTRGFHYCKVLSPARSMEWIYVDGLRAKYSLRSQGNKASK